MIIIMHRVIDVVRLKEDGQLLAVYQSFNSPHSACYVVDEQRQEIARWEDEEDLFQPYVRQKPLKKDIVKVRESKEKRALIYRLNQQIIWSNLSAVGEILEQVDERVMTWLPLDDGYMRPTVDREAVKYASRQVKALASVKQACDQMKKLLKNAEETDAVALKRFALRPPSNAESVANEKGSE